MAAQLYIQWAQDISWHIIGCQEVKNSYSKGGIQRIPPSCSLCPSQPSWLGWASGSNLLVDAQIQQEVFLTPPKNFIKYLPETLVEAIFEKNKTKQNNAFSLVLKRVNILGVKPLEWHQARIWPHVAAWRQKESEFSLSTGAYSWPQPVKADDLMIHSGKRGRMTSGLSFPHHFYQLPPESQHIGGQDDCTPQSQAVLLSLPLEQEHEGGSLCDTWEFSSKTEAVHQPREDKLNISFICRGFQR